MRRISKVVLLVAPVLLATCGCASKPAWVAQKPEAQASEERVSDRSERILKIAEKYEADGRTDVAYQLYRHIAAQDPQCAAAKVKMAALASQKQAPSPQVASATPEANSATKSRVYTPKVRPDIVEVDWEEAKRQAVLQSLAEVEEKKVNNIDLSYQAAAGPKEDTAVKPEAETEWRETAVAEVQPEFEVVEPAAEPAVARPIAEFQPASSKVSSDGLKDLPKSTEWWSAEAPSESVEPTLAELTVQADEAAVKQAEYSPAVEQPDLALAEAAESRADTVVVPKQEVAASSEELSETKIAQRIEEKPVVEPASPPQPVVAIETAVTAPVAVEPEAEKIQSVQFLCEEAASEELIQVVALLDCPEPEVRIAGLIELGIKGAEALPTSPAVRALLNDGDAMVRAHAAGTVNDIEGLNDDSVRHLAYLLGESDEEVVRLSCYLLGQMGAHAQPAVKELKKVRDEQNGLTSLHAAEALTRIVPSETRSYGVLKNALSSSDSEVRVFAAVSLGGVYEEAGHIAALALTDALQSKDADVRASAALSLGGLGKHAAIAVDQLKSLSQTDEPAVRDAALTALACLGE